MSFDQISIFPEISPYFLTAMVEGYAGLSYQVRINFIKNYFIAIEWRNKDHRRPITVINPESYGSFDEFKREFQDLKIWEWAPIYRKEDGIILEGQYWSVKLKTHGKVYESIGAQAFPPNWKRFCKAIEKLTGAPFR